jgi:hypothetical protein
VEIYFNEYDHAVYNTIFMDHNILFNVVMKPGSVLLPRINKFTFSVFFILFLPFSRLLWGYFWVLAKTLTIYDNYCRKIFRVTTVIVVFRKNIILLEFSSLTIVVNLEHFITSKHGGHLDLAILKGSGWQNNLPDSRSGELTKTTGPLGNLSNKVCRSGANFLDWRRHVFRKNIIL